MHDHQYENPLLNEREKTHGSFPDKALLIQNIKAMLRFETGWEALSPAQQEALDMIVSKIGRIMTGNPNEPDHWADIAGYAGLAEASISKGYDYPFDEPRL